MGLIRGAGNAAANMVLYWGSGSPPAWRVQICLEEKNLGDYQSKMLDMSKGENKSAEMLALNPRGQIPTFKDGDIVVTESAAICQYLEDVYKSSGTRLIPDEPRQKALVLRKAQEASNLYTVVRASLMYFLWSPKESRDEATTRQKTLDARNELMLWEGHLAKQKTRYMAGKDFTMADAAAFPFIAMFVRLGVKLGPPNFTYLGQYYDDLKTRPSISKTWPPHWKTSPPSTALSDA